MKRSFTSWERLRASWRSAVRVFRLEWRGEWTPMLTDLQSMRAEVARQTNAKPVADPLRHEAFFASMVARMNLRAIEDVLQELVDEACTYDGALRVIARADAEFAPAIEPAQPADFLLAWKAALRGFILATVMHRAADQQVWFFGEALEQEQRDRERGKRVH